MMHGTVASNAKGRATYPNIQCHVKNKGLFRKHGLREIQAILSYGTVKIITYLDSSF